MSNWPPLVPRPDSVVVRALDTPCSCKAPPALYRISTHGWGMACTRCGRGIPEPSATRQGAAEANR